MDPSDKDPDPDTLKLPGYPIRPRPRYYYPVLVVPSVIMDRSGHPWVQVDGVAPDKPLDSLSRDRRVRMLNDMYLQCRDAPLHHCPGLLILVSNHFSGDPFYMELFQDMKHQNYHPFLIIPREHSNISESPDEWPLSLFNRPRKSSQGPLPKKPKLDAA
ncbi:hypothetical protein F2Q69_00018410 [Brassica cretica]|uniref:Uncharacterized protein n=1 Tax=Brassica cretica TaxID=69181 RepID=A0A8S9QKR5_BRACR|nr:hypothetical protein F2Q69_00018410 [Brassica cretica]